MKIDDNTTIAELAEIVGRRELYLCRESGGWCIHVDKKLMRSFSTLAATLDKALCPPPPATVTGVRELEELQARLAVILDNLRRNLA